MNSSSVSSRRAVVAVRVADVDDVGDERLEGGAERGDAVDRERAEGGAVVGEPAGDGLPAALAAGGVVAARELPGGLDRLGAAGDEEDAVQVAGGERGDLGGELDRAGVRVAPVRVEGQLAHLLVRGAADLVAVGVADLHREQAGERVEVAVALVVLEVAALAADDDRRLVAAHAREVQPEVVLGEPAEVFGGGHGGTLADCPGRENGASGAGRQTRCLTPPDNADTLREKPVFKPIPTPQGGVRHRLWTQGKPGV